MSLENILRAIFTTGAVVGVDRVAYLARSIRPVDAGSCSHILFLLTLAEGFSACLLHGKTSQRKGETYYDFLIIHFYSVLLF